MERLIFLPLFAMVALTFVVGLFSIFYRFRDVLNKKIPAKYFLKFDKGEPTHEVFIANRNYVNLFEMPVLFYVLMTIVIALKIESIFLLSGAWIYVVMRAYHSFIHLTSNHLMSRMASFVLSSAVLIVMWIALFIEIFKNPAV